jgi:hypothetical protein
MYNNVESHTESKPAIITNNTLKSIETKKPN